MGPGGDDEQELTSGSQFVANDRTGGSDQFAVNDRSGASS